MKNYNLKNSNMGKTLTVNVTNIDKYDNFIPTQTSLSLSKCID